MKDLTPEEKRNTDSEKLLDFQDLHPIPRITIEAFCETREVLNSMEHAKQDRRMARSHMKAEMGGMFNALEWYSSNLTPNLIIIESAADRESLIPALRTLSERCGSETKVIIIGHQNDIALYRDLMGLGISEYMITPVSFSAIIRSIAKIFMDPEASPIGKVIAFMGAKGGSGSSTLAHNVAWNISSFFNYEVILGDLDLPFGTAAINFDQDAERGIADAVFTLEKLDAVYLDRLLLQCSERLSLLSAPCSLDRVYDLPPEAFVAVIETAQRNVPFVILDVPHAWNEWTRETLKYVDEIVIVSEPDLIGLRNTKNLMEVLKRLRPNDNLPKLIINKTGMIKKSEISSSEFLKILNITPLANIPFEPRLFSMASNNGHMLRETEEKNPVSNIVYELSQVLVGGKSSEQKSSSILARIIEAFQYTGKESRTKGVFNVW